MRNVTRLAKNQISLNFKSDILSPFLLKAKDQLKSMNRMLHTLQNNLTEVKVELKHQQNRMTQSIVNMAEERENQTKAMS